MAVADDPSGAAAATAAMTMIDEAYEFSAPRFFDFINGETEEDERKAELWFDSALSYGPSRTFSSPLPWWLGKFVVDSCCFRLILLSVRHFALERRFRIFPSCFSSQVWSCFVFCPRDWLDGTQVEMLPSQLSGVHKQSDILALLVAWVWRCSFSFSVESWGVCRINGWNQFPSALNGWELGFCQTEDR